MSSWDDFDPSLAGMLKKVWEKRPQIRALPPQARADRIYHYYNRADGPTQAPARVHGVDMALAGFLMRLDGIMKKNPALKVLVQHSGGSYAYPACAEQFKGNDSPKSSQLDKAQLNKAFYHVRPVGADVNAATKRVYVHAAPRWTNCIELMELLTPLLHPTIQGFVNVKTVGPGGQSRVDTIVAYMTDDNAQAQVVAALRHAQGSLFAANVPRAVAPVPGLTGVGITDEPPNVQLSGDLTQPPTRACPECERPMKATFESDGLTHYRCSKGHEYREGGHLPEQPIFTQDYVNPQPQSFGKFLSRVAEWALEDAGDDEQTFINLLLTGFEIVRVDPKNPHLHPERELLEEWQRMGFQAAERRMLARRRNQHIQK